VLETGTAAFSMALNGCGVMRPQLVYVAVFITLALPLKFVLAQHLGLAGIVWAAVLSQAVAVPLLYATVYRKQMAGLLCGEASGQVQRASESVWVMAPMRPRTRKKP
jgi:Na+-driven multidrug efflux pump